MRVLQADSAYPSENGPTKPLTGSTGKKKAGKQVLNYFEQLQDLEKFGQEQGKIKDVFFGRGTTLANGLQGQKQDDTEPTLIPNRKHASTKYTRKHALSKSFAPQTSAGAQYMIDTTPVLEENDKDYLKIRRKFKKINTDSVDNRITIGKIKEKSTILKNVNSLDEDSMVSEDEQAIFKRVTTLLETHLADDDYLFKSLIHTIQEYLVKKYQPILEQISNKELSEVDIEMHCLDLCKEINDFMKVLVKTLILFYNFDVCNFRVMDKETKVTCYLPCTILNFDNLMNFTTIMMFPTQIYSMVLEFMRAKNRKKDEKFLNSIKTNQKNITMAGLGIDEKFRLNKEVTLTNTEFLKNNAQYSFHDRELLASKLKKAGEDQDGLPGDTLASEERESRGFGMGIRKLSEMGADAHERLTLMSQLIKPGQSQLHRSTFALLEDDFANDAYRDAIKTLRYLPEVESPFEKMKTLLMVIRRIIKTINEHYMGANKSKQEVLTGDQIMSLVVYVVLRAKVPNMFTYIEFVETFLPPKLFNTFCGYYLTVFHAASEYITEFNPNKQAT